MLMNYVINDNINDILGGPARLPQKWRRKRRGSYAASTCRSADDAIRRLPKVKALSAARQHQPLVIAETSIVDIHSDIKPAVARPKPTGF
jgi:hypothetical protein